MSDKRDKRSRVVVLNPNFTPSASTPLLLRTTDSRLAQSASIYYTMSDVTEPRTSGLAKQCRAFNNSSESVVSSLSTRSSRRPFHIPVNKQFIGQPVCEDADLGVSATYSRHRYYSRLVGNHAEESNMLRVPDHILPIHFLIPKLPFNDGDGKQGSLLTVFAIWNMLMGSTLLCLPWALHQAGLYFGIVAMLFMLYFCFYTANLIVKIPKLANLQCQEFSEACGN